MSDITPSEWRLLRQEFGDLAYEEAHRHREMLKILRRRKLRIVVNNDKQ